MNKVMFDGLDSLVAEYGYTKTLAALKNEESKAARDSAQYVYTCYLIEYNKAV